MTEAIFGTLIYVVGMLLLCRKMFGTITITRN
jgi:hypothetical protein